MVFWFMVPKTNFKVFHEFKIKLMQIDVRSIELRLQELYQIALGNIVML
jgi:hypothetical protein